MRLGWIGIAALLFLNFTCQAQDPCRSCHPKEVAAFEASPMGRSVSDPNITATGRLHHGASGSTITVELRGGNMWHRAERRGLIASYPFAYSVGAGFVGYSHMLRIGEYLFQSPVPFYTKSNFVGRHTRLRVGSAPGFYSPDYDRVSVLPYGFALPAARASNRFKDPPFTPISSDRCHGSARQHLSNPVPRSIANPAKLPHIERDSVCEQCHLEGVARILNPGLNWSGLQGWGGARTSLHHLCGRGTHGSCPRCQS